MNQKQVGDVLFQQHIQNSWNSTEKMSLAPRKDNMQIQEAAHRKDLVTKTRLEPIPDCFPFNSKGLQRFLFSVSTSTMVDTHPLHYGQEAAHRAAHTVTSRVRNSFSSRKGRLEFSIWLSKRNKYYFINNKSVLFGPLDQSRRIKLNMLSNFSHTVNKISKPMISEIEYGLLYPKRSTLLLLHAHTSKKS